MHGKAVRVSGGAFLLGAFLLLTVPLKWVFALAGSIALHELFHLAALKAFGVTVSGMEVGPGGIRMETEPMVWWQEGLCALAGPASFVPTLLLARWFPRLAVCALFHAGYNLLPVYPLDGGRAVRAFSAGLLGEKAGRQVCRVLEVLCRLSICAAGVYGTVILRLGLFPLVCAALILVRVGNNSCKEREGRVQWAYQRKAKVRYDTGNGANSPHGAKACQIYRRGIQ